MRVHGAGVGKYGAETVQQQLSRHGAIIGTFESGKRIPGRTVQAQRQTVQSRIIRERLDDTVTLNPRLTGGGAFDAPPPEYSR